MKSKKSYPQNNNKYTIKNNIFMFKVAPCSVVSPSGKCWWFNKINKSKIKELKTIIKSDIKVLLLYFNAIICTMVHLHVPFLRMPH